jgi:hypothetical protein
MQQGLTPQQVIAKMNRNNPKIAEMQQHLQGKGDGDITQYAMNTARAMGADPQSLLKQNGIDQRLFNRG